MRENVQTIINSECTRVMASITSYLRILAYTKIKHCTVYTCAKGPTPPTTQIWYDVIWQSMISVKIDFILVCMSSISSRGHLDLSEMQEMRLFYFNYYLYIILLLLLYVYLVFCSCLLLHHWDHNWTRNYHAIMYTWVNGGSPYSPWI